MRTSLLSLRIRAVGVFLGLLLLGNFSGHQLVAQSSLQFDMVLVGGRVIDPETGLDEIRSIGIRNGRIAEISSLSLEGKEVIDVSGLVVAPGFIDLHVHGITNKEQAYQVRDGVTTALELEWGVPALKSWYQSRESRSLINYGASVNWAVCRSEGIEQAKAAIGEIQQTVTNGNYEGVQSIAQFLRTIKSEALSGAPLNRMLDCIGHTLRAGGLGIGMPIENVPGASEEEIFKVYQLAGSWKAPIFVHVRTGALMAIQQAIANAVLTDAPLHIVHINSSALKDIELAIEMVHTAQSRGFDITTEVYPYNASSTELKSSIFDEGWQERMGVDYEDLQWVATGERLTEESFEAYRKTGGTVINHMMKPEWISFGLASADVVIASDGMRYERLAHPRTAGTFSRVLGKYVREEQLMSLPEAIRKMTFLPAKRLEIVSPMMGFKGRIQVGCDADLTIFNPETIIDKATFEEGLRFSEGIEHVLVNGVFVVRDRLTVEGVFPGRAVFGKYKK